MLPNKEQEPPVNPNELVKIVEYLDVPEIDPNIERIEAVSKDQPALQNPVTDDSGQVIVSNPIPATVQIVLPLTEAEMNQALHLKIIYSLRWLATQVERLIKIKGGKYFYSFSANRNNKTN